jgi:hypothetical protein
MGISENYKFGKLADDADEIDKGLLKAERKIKRAKNKRKKDLDKPSPDRR